MIEEAYRAEFRPELRYVNPVVEDPFKDACAVFVYRGFIAAVYKTLPALYDTEDAKKNGWAGTQLYYACTLNTKTVHKCWHYTIEDCLNVFKCTVCRMIGEGERPVCWK